MGLLSLESLLLLTSPESLLLLNTGLPLLSGDLLLTTGLLLPDRDLLLLTGLLELFFLDEDLLLRSLSSRFILREKMCFYKNSLFCLKIFKL